MAVRHRHEITGLVLCGGAGRRMGGIDKPLLEWRGQPLIAHVLERIRPQCGPLLINANRSHDEYARYGLPVISDQITDVGPLGGVHAASPAVQTPLLFACAGDMPELDPSIVIRLADVLQPDDDVAVPHDGEQLQSLVLLLRARALPSLGVFLDTGGRAVHAWLGTLRMRTLDARALAPSFRNVNTPGDLVPD